MKQQNDVKHISKIISYWLRHKPQEAGIELDEFGWASLPQVLGALANRGLTMTVEELHTLNHATDKVRWEIDQANQKIRATHGHSVSVVLLEKPTIPPAVLYHGTAVPTVISILEEGLWPMRRQFVHLSSTPDMALQVGRRHGKAVLFEIATAALVQEGWLFYHTSDNVWLTTAVPAHYLTLIS
ncbi:RNA 2'-phosphotransferase [Hymenobacter aerilatus]|uniref:Probable RNA 2'-phosphotransferase n=1 Tax=Hymenobacter aerilatus TaxID=2932251 RepID=A0A8T9T3I8_9BACT|nr:RNA 2'-phosphotransferase [Hymenobacter aerilatus]UOR06676.1 RNA 2'-phosphotransferase [Hymenobacter aerilatus]